jgi:hypothetical protein
MEPSDGIIVRQVAALKDTAFVERADGSLAQVTHDGW